MATFNKYNIFVQDLASGVHTFGSDTLKVALTNTTPNATDEILTDIGQITAGSGYTAGGNTATTTSALQTAGVFRLVLADPPSWTGDGAGMEAFQYAVLYNDTPADPVDPLIGYWDYGASVGLNSGDVFTVDFNPTSGVLTIQ